MKTITLNVSGIKFPTTFKTVVTKIVSPEENSSIVLDAIPNVEISLNGESAKNLGLEKDMQVTIKPKDGVTDGSFDLEIGEKVKKKDSAPSSGRSSPSRNFMMGIKPKRNEALTSALPSVTELFS